jgi:hypothetical protein
MGKAAHLYARGHEAKTSSEVVADLKAPDRCLAMLPKPSLEHRESRAEPDHEVAGGAHEQVGRDVADEAARVRVV